MPALLAEGPPPSRPPSPHPRLSVSIDQHLLDARNLSRPSVRVDAAFARALNCLLASPRRAWRSASQPLSNVASEGLSTVLMRISMFVLFMCVTLILLAISCFAGSRNNLCVAQVALDRRLAGWSFHAEHVV